ncbi:terminal uridylyltransferase Tailor-like [Chironomus tepperi]|uniref:terminal uridylyltransferase Tailor-like n=1 Tax=Chironomus tepperi TaxID=113505 RepID=UPI00391FBBE0
MVKFSFSAKIQRKLNWYLDRGHDIALYTSRYSAGRSEMTRYDNVSLFLERALSMHNLTSTVHYFGSRVSGTSVGRSDIDFFVEIGDNFCSPNSQEEAAKVLRKIKNAIDKSHEFKVEIFLPKATVPLLKVVYLKTDFKCDIVASSGLSVRLCEIINHLNSLQPQIIPLFHYIRIWIHLCGINIKRYVQFLLIFYYLQQNNYMPSIKNIQKNLPKEFIGDWEVQFDPSRTLQSYGVKKMTNFVNHIVGYFRFYSNVKFEELVLSIYEGKCIKRSEYKKYDTFKIEKPLCMAGVLDQSFNSGQTVSKTAMQKFSGMCQLSVEFLIQRG